jgi:diketogulonate reductase-like aldo/keto reductase
MYHSPSRLSLLRIVMTMMMSLWLLVLSVVTVTTRTTPAQQAPRTTTTTSNLFRGYAGGGSGKLDDVMTVTLRNDIAFPLVGQGVGNLPRHLVEGMIHDGLQSSQRIRLIDTAHQSGNERDVAKGIVTGVHAFGKELSAAAATTQKETRIQVHVVTKIWYTYLGYGRTKMAIDDILQELQQAIKDPRVDLKVTILLHWPRCYETIPWMECQKEEEQLPSRVKQAGPAPHLDTKNAWKESWMALEDVYQSADYPWVAAIGVSNFDRHDMTELLQMARTIPHLTQINVWSVIHDPSLMELFQKSGTHVQVYNVMNGIVGNIDHNPKAYHHLLMIASQLERDATAASGTTRSHDEPIQVSTSQVILKWLTQLGMSVIPRTSQTHRLRENSAVALHSIPTMTDSQMDIVKRCIIALLNNQDLSEDVSVQVRFHAKHYDMFVYWVPPITADKGDDVRLEEQQVAFVAAGDSIVEHTHPGHQFKVYNAQDPDHYQTYAIHGQYGDVQEIHVEL